METWSTPDRHYRTTRTPTVTLTNGTRCSDRLSTAARSTKTQYLPENYQCTPRISEANAICSLLGASSLPFMPLAAALSGNRVKAVFITTS